MLEAKTLQFLALEIHSSHGRAVLMREMKWRSRAIDGLGHLGAGGVQQRVHDQQDERIEEGLSLERDGWLE